MPISTANGWSISLLVCIGAELMGDGYSNRRDEEADVGV